jgi:hypothetical protein
MDFVLFLLVNFALFLRPQDLIDALAGVPIYNTLILMNLLVATPAILNHLRGGWRAAPATVCVAGIIVAVVLSLAVRADLAGAWYFGVEFLKVAAYFLLMMAVLRTSRRFAIYLTTIVVLTILLSALAVASFHGQLDIPAIQHARETQFDALDGSAFDFYRLAAFGVFADPNDLSMVVVLSMMVCIGALLYRPLGAVRFATIAPLAFLAYTLALTQSRGGLIALLVGSTALFLARYDLLRSSWAIAAVVPAVLVLFGGRQAAFSSAISTGTGAQRTELWYAGLQMIKWSPLLGIGHGRFVESEGLVAHSSYVQALAEWGFFGGAMFIGLFYIALTSVWRLKRVRKEIRSPVLRNLQPCVMGALAAYAASMLTLTRCDVVPTYLVAGLGVSYERLARRGTPLAPVRLTRSLMLRIAAATVGFVTLLYVYIRFVFRLF